MKTIFKRLASSDTLGKSPARDIKQLAANERSFHVLTPDEEKVYLLACSQPLQDVAALMLESGMRPIEIYKLKRRDAGWGGTQRLPRLVAEAKALEMFLTAKRVDAVEALRIGLIDKISENPVAESLANYSGNSSSISL